MTTRPLRLLAAALCLVALLAACSDDDGPDDATDGTGSSTTTEAGTDEATTDPEAEGATLAERAERGPHGVGSLTLDLDGRRVAVWYPAVAGAGTEEPTDTFDITSLLSPELQAQVPAEARVQYPVAAQAGAEPAEGGPFPVVVFSHGFAGFPEQSVDLTTHLASWGYVVAAPDHVERSLSGLLGTAAQGVTPADDPAVLGATLDLVATTGDDAASPLSGLVDLERVGVVGHSAGAGAAYRTAADDDRVDAFVALSLGSGRDGEGLGAVPEVPGLVMLGEADETIPAATTREVAGGLTATPSYLVEVAEAGHLVFSDLCLIGAEQGGLTGIVESIGLDIPADFLRLASDGCGDGYPAVTDAFPAIDAVTVAFLDTTVAGVDDAPELAPGPVDLGPAQVELSEA